MVDFRAEYEMGVRVGKSRRIVLETRTFDKVGDASTFFTEILRSYSLADKVSASDEKELIALLKRHDEIIEKTGTGILHFEVNSPPADAPPFSDRCFWIVRTDGSKIDFSIGHCLEKKPYE